MSPKLDFVSVAPAEAPESLVIWMHGLGADGHDFEPLVPQLGLPRTQFIFPHAPVRPVTINNGMHMRAWYDFLNLDFSRSEDMTQIEESVADVEALVDWAAVQYSLPHDRIVLAGFSQGGVIALLAGLRSSSRYAGVLALSTYLPQAALPQAPSCQTVFQCHGDADSIIPLPVAESAANFLKKHCPEQHRMEIYPMEHQLCPDEITDIQAWFRKVLG